MRQQELRYRITYSPDLRAFGLYVRGIWRGTTLSLDDLLCWIKEDVEEWLIPKDSKEEPA